MAATGAGGEVMLGRSLKSSCPMTNSSVGVAVAFGIDVGWNAADAGKGAGGRDWILLDYNASS